MGSLHFVNITSGSVDTTRLASILVAVEGYGSRTELPGLGIHIWVAKGEMFLSFESRLTKKLAVVRLVPGKGLQRARHGPAGSFESDGFQRSMGPVMVNGLCRLTPVLQEGFNNESATANRMRGNFPAVAFTTTLRDPTHAGVPQDLSSAGWRR
jgi:hypothetical protein